MTDYEWDLLQLKILDQPVIPVDKAEKLKTLLSNIDQKPFEDGPDDWVTNVENIIPVLKVGLIGCDDRIGQYCWFLTGVECFRLDTE